jgi:hypothetical protein
MLGRPASGDHRPAISFFASFVIIRYETVEKELVDETFRSRARSAPAQLHSLKKSGLYTSGMKSLSLPDSVSNIDRSHSA